MQRHARGCYTQVVAYSPTIYIYNLFIYFIINKIEGRLRYFLCLTYVLNSSIAYSLIIWLLL